MLFRDLPRLNPFIVARFMFNIVSIRINYVYFQFIKKLSNISFIFELYIFKLFVKNNTYKKNM